jgi:aspartate carbamoyltransferase regulatory subunit|uniref:Aspartate carbamoyltransferase regulatory chain n=1 Tax=Caldisericum exile TaxID=693075 RepID=A0A7C4TVL3_9BACT
MERKLKVDAIKEGTVIDHIPRAKALDVIKILKLKEEDIITIGINFSSKKLGRKDIIKIENKELTEEEVNKIALIAPDATLNIIKDYNVVKKIEIKLPEVLEGIIKCPNPNCISNNEKVISRFFVISEKPVKVRCAYCERIFTSDEIEYEY